MSVVRQRKVSTTFLSIFSIKLVEDLFILAIRIGGLWQIASRKMPEGLFYLTMDLTCRDILR